jgi:hypothetical protein
MSTPKEISLKTYPFDGDRTKTDGWFFSINAFLRINKKIYDMNEKQVLYALSLMTEKTARVWAEDFY